MQPTAIQIQADDNHSTVQGELIDVARAASIRVFEHSAPSGDVGLVRLDSVSGVLKGAHIQSTVGEVSTLGDVRLFASHCVSDSSLLGEHPLVSGTATAGLWMESEPAGALAHMTHDHSTAHLGHDLTGLIPKIDAALAGHLSAGELNQLIADLQSQVLDLNSGGQQLFGDLSSDIHSTVHELQGLDSHVLLSTMSLDSAYLGDPVLDAMTASTPLATLTTLDGLFTSPEAFPLTLDFSNPHSVHEATELFAAAGGSSINSSASSADSGLVADSGNNTNDLG
ncbi:hypothetical protein NQT62_12570 [Limnobacter humi]|uniref:Retention module-containing protein n=1 Tax=Limnobacter humi TaxID=1778671 RepID=A0ABT1WIN1_9BURK|nr:hypothetical protein [Limnobacter humi]MCQ8897269.1 hypothetical protein [Limnobacter humi]